MIRPMRSPVKLPGPIPTAIPSSLRVTDAAAAEQRVEILEHGDRRAT